MLKVDVCFVSRVLRREVEELEQEQVKVMGNMRLQPQCREQGRRLCVLCEKSMGRRASPMELVKLEKARKI